MNWDAIGAIGETLGALGVLITVGYLAVQLRQNTQALKTSALRSAEDVVLLTEKNERYIAHVMKVQRKEKLTEEERAQTVERFLTIMRTFERIWQEHKLGSVTQYQFEQHLDLLRWAMSSPATRLMWGYLAQTFDPGYRAIVEEKVLADGAPTSSIVKAYLALDTQTNE